MLYLTGFSDSLFKAKTMPWSDEAFLDKRCSVGELIEAVSMLLFGRVGHDRSVCALTGRR